MEPVTAMRTAATLPSKTAPSAQRALDGSLMEPAVLRLRPMRMTTFPLRRLAPVTAALAALAVAGGTTYAIQRDAGGRGSVLYRDRGSSAPPVLHLDSPGGGGTTGSSGAEADGRYVLATKLPQGPDRAPVHSLQAPSEKTMESLARALGLTRAEDVEDVDASVIVFTGRGELRIEESAGYRWSFSPGGTSRCAGLEATDLPAEQPTCTTTVDPNPSAEQSRTGAPPAPEARRAARSILLALGLDPERATVTRHGPLTTVSVHPEVDGLPTTGMETSVAVGAAGVVSAYGWFNETTEGTAYPVTPAAEAFKLLANRPQPLSDRACPEPAPGTGFGDCAGGPVTIVGAKFGLSLQWGERQPLLVPAWLFEVAGNPYPIAQVAVEPGYLGQPRAVPPEPGVTDKPADPGSPPDRTTSTFQSVRVSDDGRTVKVTFYGGVEACNIYELVAKETPDAAYLVLNHSRPATAGACIEIAELREAAVSLDEPIGNRRLVDATTDSTLRAVPAS